ncbi:hypothetical protein DCAR_0728478 [Daucus carota subsp. sativus]|uniref:Uncharacterized protein n=1 Tax=Daucus carota subsp. sativus TaxID=79200 RepID=A0A164TLJ2_DAUCS|nr:hypothetical protein DCAR_0728478 [Daucus carota subsp. sativus]
MAISNPPASVPEEQETQHCNHTLPVLGTAIPVGPPSSSSLSTFRPPTNVDNTSFLATRTPLRSPTSSISPPSVLATSIPADPPVSSSLHCFGNTVSESNSCPSHQSPAPSFNSMESMDEEYIVVAEVDASEDPSQPFPYATAESSNSQQNEVYDEYVVADEGGVSEDLVQEDVFTNSLHPQSASDSYLIQISTEESITIIPDYIATLAKCDDDIIESSNSKKHEDDDYILVKDVSKDPTPEVNRVRAAIERTFKKYLPADRRPNAEADQLSYKLISHELLRIFGIGFQINIYIPLNKYLKQVLDELPEGNVGIEYADAIEKIARKLLDLAAAMKRNTSSLPTLEEP